MCISRTVPRAIYIQDAKCACGNSSDLYTSGPHVLHVYSNCLCLVKLFILDGHIWRSWFVLACMIVISLYRRGCSYFSMHDYIHLFAYYQPGKDDNQLKGADQYDQCRLIHEIWWNLRLTFCLAFAERFSDKILGTTRNLHRNNRVQKIHRTIGWTTVIWSGEVLVLVLAQAPYAKAPAL